MASWDLFVTNCKILQWRKINWPFLYLKFEIRIIVFPWIRFMGFGKPYWLCSPAFSLLFWSFPKKFNQLGIDGLPTDWKEWFENAQPTSLSCNFWSARLLSLLLGFLALGKKIYLFLLLRIPEGWRLVLVYRAFKLQLLSPSFMRGQDIAHRYTILLRLGSNLILNYNLKSSNST